MWETACHTPFPKCKEKKIHLRHCFIRQSSYEKKKVYKVGLTFATSVFVKAKFSKPTWRWWQIVLQVCVPHINLSSFLNKLSLDRIQTCENSQGKRIINTFIVIIFKITSDNCIFLILLHFFPTRKCWDPLLFTFFVFGFD